MTKNKNEQWEKLQQVFAGVFEEDLDTLRNPCGVGEDKLLQRLMAVHGDRRYSTQDS